jgi:hypothetical protein
MALCKCFWQGKCIYYIFLDIKVIHKVRKTQHQNPKFDLTWARLKKTEKNTLAFNGGSNSENQQF